jgi:hypothetical protein
MKAVQMLRVSLISLACLFATQAGMCTSPTSPQADVIVLEVAPRTVACVGEVARQCLQVRTSPDSAWTRFYDTIEGFTYEEGFQYRLEVQRDRVPNPPADASSYRYRLLRLLSRERMP